jgi:hypothetical protein
MQEQEWKKVLERHYSSEQLEHWKQNPPPPGFDQDEYGRRWAELGERIEAALPLDPASEEAQRFVDEWNALLAPFRAVATPQMMADAQSFWDKAQDHGAEVQMPFSLEVMRFIREVQAVRAPR